MQNDIFSQNGPRVDADEMLDWSTRLSALGRVIYHLAHHESDALVQEGQELGDIISDYSGKLEKAICAARGAIRQGFNTDDGTLSWELKREFAHIKKMHPCPARVQDVNKHLEKIDRFIAEIETISELRTEFLKLREESFSGHSRPGAVVNE